MKPKMILSILILIIIVSVFSYSQGVQKNQDEKISLESRVLKLETEVKRLSDKVKMLEERVENPPTKIIPLK